MGAHMIDTQTDSGVYLRSSTKIEPLSCGWYAWGHLIAPVQHALNLAFRQLPLLKSFVATPAIHEAAARDPDMLGAAFIQLPRTQLRQIAALEAATAAQCRHLIQFAQDLMDLARQLQASAAGFSLEEGYSRIPESLRGLIELTYDLDNHPALRIVEELVAGGVLDNSSTQQIALFDTQDRERGFFLNTPRFESEQRMIIPMPFASERVDVLAASRIHATAPALLLEALQVPPERAQRFLQLFTSTAPQRKQPAYDGNEVRVRYFGHACVLVQSSEVAVLIDPLLVCGRDESEATLTFDDLPDRIDYVFLTHNHHDHLCPEILLQLRKRIGHILVPRNNPANLADPSIKLTLGALGFHNVIVMDALDRIALPDGEIVSLPFYGEHADLSIASKHGMYLRLKGRTLAFLADSNCLDRMLYRRLLARLGAVATLFIGMECHGAPLSWLYGPYLPDPIKRKDDESRRLSGCDSERAWAVVEELGCTRVFVYAMGQEPWLKYLSGLQYTPDSKQIVESEKLLERCRSAGVPAERLYGCRELTL